MSACNGCRVLRRRCGGEKCMLRHSLQGLATQQAQANATVFVAKFFGRVTLMSFLSSVSQDQRPALFESLLYEAVGRVVNPVSGAVGLLGAGNWHTCQSAVETVLRLGPSGLISGGGSSEGQFPLGRRRLKRRLIESNGNEKANIEPSVSQCLDILNESVTVTKKTLSCLEKGKALKLFI